MNYKCSCCGYFTLPALARDARAFICPVCFWENDPTLRSKDEASELNYGISLREGIINFKRLGVCDGRYMEYVRRPYPEELEGLD